MHFNKTVMICLPSFCIYVGKQDRLQCMPCKSTSWLSLCWFFSACYTKETEASILSSCYSSIYLGISMLQVLWFLSLPSPFSVSPSSLCRMKIKIFWVSLQSFQKNTFFLLWLLPQVSSCSKTNINAYKRQLWSLRCMCYQMSGRYCTNKMCKW